MLCTMDIESPVRHAFAFPDRETSSGGVFLFKFGQDSFVLAGSCDPKAAPFSPEIVLNGSPVKERFFTFTESDTSRAELTVTVFPAKIREGDRLQWFIAPGIALVDATLGLDVRARPLNQFPTLLNRLATPAARHAFIRRVLDTLLVYAKKQSDTEVVSNLSKVLLESLRDYRVDAGSVLPVSDAVSIVEVPGHVSATDITGVSVIDRHGIRSNVARPVVAGNADASLLAIRVSSDVLRDAAIVLWRQTEATLLTLQGATLIDQAKFLSVLIFKQPGIWQRSLQESLGLVAQNDQATKSFIQTLSVLAPAISQQSLSLGDRLKVGISLSVRAADGNLVAIGWLFDPLEAVKDIYWKGPNETRIPLRITQAPKAENYKIPNDIRDLVGKKQLASAVGFIAAAKTPSPALALCQELFEVELNSGVTFGLVPPPGSTLVADARDAILAVPKLNPANQKAALEKLAPTLRALHKEALSGDRVKDVFDLGVPPKKPRVSIIVPVFRNLEFIRTQYTSLALGAAHKPDQLVYVCDDPTIEENFVSILRSLHALYGLSIRVVLLNKNYGYAAASNEGVKASSGKHVLLLNSDAIPRDAGFLEKLLKPLQAKQRTAAAGAKMVFADQSVQHVGLTHFKDFYGRVSNRSLQKGYPAGVDRNKKLTDVDAATGACLLIPRAHFDAVGGVSEDYIVGDFEDTDLCQRLTRDFGRIVVVHDSVVVHFERQSMASHKTHLYSAAELYNQWLYQTRWFSEPDRTQKQGRVRLAIPS
jgi:GT2 family glycosyltransferase